MTFRSIFVSISLLAALFVVGCQAQGDTQVRQVLNTVCPSVDVVYSHYQAVSSLVSPRTQSRVELVKQQADMLCAGRETATTVTILATGSMVFLAVRDALKEARSNEASVAYSGDLNKLEGFLRKVRRN